MLLIKKRKKKLIFLGTMNIVADADPTADDDN